VVKLPSKRARRREKTQKFEETSRAWGGRGSFDEYLHGKGCDSVTEYTEYINRLEKKQDYGAAGLSLLQAAKLLSKNDLRAAAKYATKAEKDFVKAREQEEASPWDYRAHGGMSYRDLKGHLKEAHKLAQALRHEAAKRKVKGKGLEHHVATAVFLIIGAAGIFFLSPNITGNVIGNNSIATTNIAGAILFFIGLIGLFFTFKRNK
jgi:hypothetical protein